MRKESVIDIREIASANNCPHTLSEDCEETMGTGIPVVGEGTHLPASHPSVPDVSPLSHDHMKPVASETSGTLEDVSSRKKTKRRSDLLEAKGGNEHPNREFCTRSFSATAMDNQKKSKKEIPSLIPSLMHQHELYGYKGDLDLVPSPLLPHPLGLMGGPESVESPSEHIPIHLRLGLGSDFAQFLRKPMSPFCLSDGHTTTIAPSALASAAAGSEDMSTNFEDEDWSRSSTLCHDGPEDTLSEMIETLRSRELVETQKALKGLFNLHQLQQNATRHRLANMEVPGAPLNPQACDAESAQQDFQVGIQPAFEALALHAHQANEVDMLNLTSAIDPVAMGLQLQHGSTQATLTMDALWPITRREADRSHAIIGKPAVGNA